VSVYIEQRKLNVGNKLQVGTKAIEKRVTLINPNPKGGAPKSNA
jgi:hypothetical protein